MACAQSTLEVDVPVRAAYDAWADIGCHPRFLAGVERAQQTAEGTWQLQGTGLSGQRAWAIRVAQQAEDEHVTLHSLDGPWDAMVVLFERLGPERTAVTLLRDHEPESGRVPDLAARVEGDLRRFKQVVEAGVVQPAPMVGVASR